jgi:hypothetical protein
MYVLQSNPQWKGCRCGFLDASIGGGKSIEWNNGKLTNNK